MALGRWVATVGSYTLGSRLLGFIRDILIAAILGAGPVSDAFFVAFKLPNFLRRLFAEGAFNAAFVPLFAGELEQNGRAAAKAFAEEVLAVLLCVLLFLVVVAQIVMPWLMYVLAPGFADDPEKFDLTVQLTRIAFPYILFISLVSLLGGVLNSLYRFAAAAATPIILNLCLIGALLGLSHVTETPGHALAIGVSAAGVLQFAWLVIALRRAGIALRLPRPRLTPRVKHMLAIIAPAALGAGVAQVNLVVDVIIASLLPEGAVSFLYYADRVNQLPLGVIGVAVGTALLPLLSRQLRAAENEAAGESQNRAIEGALLLTLPAAAALMIIAPAAISVLFERGAFTAAATAASADALIAYAAGLPAFVMIKVLVPGYFARQDTKTPVRIAIVCLVVNVGFNLALMGPLGHVGIALATTLSGWLNAALLARGLHKRGYFTADARLRRRLPRMLLATAAMTAALWAVSTALAGPIDASTGSGVGSLIALTVTGLLVYGLVALACGATHLSDIKGFWRSRPSGGAKQGDG
jgi:putative peptidoglycan lipid II flippase